MPRKSQSLDLHGYTRENALRRLTETLEICRSDTTNTLLIVVTGVGLHSQPGGAVLRPAVQKYLEDRKFSFKYQSGCFEIDTMSGELRYAIKTPAPSTKLLCTTSLPSDNAVLVPARNNNLLSSSDGASSIPPEIESLGPFPLPREVARDDQELEHGKLKSLEDYRELQRMLSKEKSAIERALELSTHDDDDDNNDPSGRDDEDDRILLEVIQLSMVDFDVETKQRARQEEDVLLQHVIDLSIHDYTESSTGGDYQDEDAQFQRILEKSVLQTFAKQEDEEDLLRIAIETSKMEAAAELQDQLILHYDG